MKSVSLFIPCMVDLFLPHIGESTYKLLKRLGTDPFYHEAQTCCGQPVFNAGRADEASRIARRFIEIFENDEMIVCPSGACVLMVKRHYPELFADQSGWLKRATSLAARVFELSQFIVDILGIEDVGASFKGKVAYHESCQVSRGLGIIMQPKKLIKATSGAELVQLQNASVCCGFGGHFSVNYPEISEALVKEKAEHFIASRADVLVLSEPGCYLNINGYLSRHYPDKKAMHIASFLTGMD